MNKRRFVIRAFLACWLFVNALYALLCTVRGTWGVVSPVEHILAFLAFTVVSALVALISYWAVNS